MSKSNRKKSEIAVGVLGMLLVGLIAAVCVMLVVAPAAADKAQCPGESGLMKMENQRDYGLYGLAGQRLGVYIDQYTAGPAPICMRN